MESKILEFVDKYDVEIELRYKKKSIVAIIDDRGKLILVRSGFINNLLEDIEKVCISINNVRRKEETELDNRLKNIDKKLFPDNLFKNNK